MLVLVGRWSSFRGGRRLRFYCTLKSYFTLNVHFCDIGIELTVNSSNLIAEKKKDKDLNAKLGHLHEKALISISNQFQTNELFVDYLILRGKIDHK